MNFYGHDKQIELFLRTIQSNRLHHAYIFSGLKGIGKRYFAVNIAKYLCCEEKIYFSKCVCRSCKTIDDGMHPDVYQYNRESLLADNIRELILNVSMTASVGTYKIVIMDDADVLSSTNQVVAANILLKTLEEPADSTIFFLITDRYDEILATIRSRAVNIMFKPLESHDVKDAVKVLRPDISFIDTAVSLSYGSIGKALDIIDSNIINVNQLLMDKEYIKFIEYIRSVPDTKTLFMVISNIYSYVLVLYKETGYYELSELSSYMLEILKRLNYNVNLDLIKSDLASKIVEVISEKN